MTPQYSAIIFDFFGVFAPDVYPEWLQKHKLVTPSTEGYYADLAKQMDQGQISKADFLGKLAEASKLTPQQVEAELNDFQIDQNLLNLVQDLSKKYKLALLCNASDQILWPIFEQYKFVLYFDQIIISSEVGLSKPDPQIFNLTLTKLGKQPGECIFIDDSFENTTAAEQLGIRSLHYNDFERLVRDLNRLGVQTVATKTD